MKIDLEVALAFCPTDTDAACRMLGWMHTLGRAKNFDAVLIPSAVCSNAMTRRVIAAADPVFRTVRVSPCQFTDAPWPVGPNLMFAWAAGVCAGPFLWIEPDCVPTRPSWLNEIAEAYQSATKPIMADWYDDQHTSGIAVYHPAAAKQLIAAGNKRAAWDSRMPELFRSLSCHTPLIQHFWGQKNGPPTFVRKYTGTPHTTTTRLLRPEAALFHRCKDGSLIEILRERLPEIQQPSGKPITRPARAFVMLGRYGDIINLLPVLRDVAKSGEKPALVTSKRFSDVLQGVSYVQPVPLPVGPFDLTEAVSFAKSNFQEVVVTQVYGKYLQTFQTAEHFNVQSWKIAGYEHRWNDPDMRLVFDRRNYRRERDLIVHHVLPAKKPVVLLNLRGGYSSPFAESQAAEDRIRGQFGDRLHFVDLADMRCDRIFDLCGMMEVAAGIVTVDTATIHLAAVSEIPTVAFLSPLGKWFQSKPRCRAVAAFPCNEWLKNWDEIEASLTDMAEHRSKIVHVFERHGELNDREKRAQATWEKTGWELAPYDKYLRDARGIGDNRDLPFLRDVLNNGLKRCGIHDYIAFTNSDIELVDGIDAAVRDAMRGLVALTARRTDYNPTGAWRGAGRDLVVFRADWLARNIQQFPDFILGACHWDWWACLLARRLVGITGDENSCHREHTPECELPHELIRHKQHHSAWQDNTQSPSEKHNRKLFEAYELNPCPV